MFELFLKNKRCILIWLLCILYNKYVTTPVSARVNSLNITWIICFAVVRDGIFKVKNRQFRRKCFPVTFNYLSYNNIHLRIKFVSSHLYILKFFEISLNLYAVMIYKIYSAYSRILYIIVYYNIQKSNEHTVTYMRTV